MALSGNSSRSNLRDRDGREAKVSSAELFF